MRGASSAGNSRANGIDEESRRAAIRGASSGGGTEITRDVSAAGGELGVKECVSIGLVGRRHAWICWAIRWV
jgi:hypothetical protein